MPGGGAPWQVCWPRYPPPMLALAREPPLATSRCRDRRTNGCLVNQARPAHRADRLAGQASPPGFWYDQPEAEWVAVLAGAARLRFQDEAEARVLGPGDCLDIAPYRRHRVDWTDPSAATVWLAVFYPCDPP